MVQSRKMTSGTIKGKKISDIFARFEACSTVTSGCDNIEHSLVMTPTFALQTLEPFAFRSIYFAKLLLLYSYSFTKATSARTRR